MGYAESKYVGELLLEASAEKCGVPAVICRVGQLAGPVTKKDGGMWSKQEWLPSVSLPSFLHCTHQQQQFFTLSPEPKRKPGHHTCYLIPSPRTDIFPPLNIGHSKLQIPRQSPHDSPEPGHSILGPSRHHRQHHRRPRPRQRPPRILILISRPGTQKTPPLQHRQPPPWLLALPRPIRNPLFPKRHRHRHRHQRQQPQKEQQKQQPHRPRPLPRLALRPPRFRRLGLRGRGQEPGHQVARLL